MKVGSRGSHIINHNKTVEINAYNVEQKDATVAAEGALNAAAFGPMEGDINWDTIKNSIYGK